jgi:hypothetical protein
MRMGLRACTERARPRGGLARAQRGCMRAPCYYSYTLPERTRLCVSIAKIDLSSESVDPRIAVHCTRTLEA